MFTVLDKLRDSNDYSMQTLDESDNCQSLSLVYDVQFSQRIQIELKKINKIMLSSFSRTNKSYERSLLRDFLGNFDTVPI